MEKRIVIWSRTSVGVGTVLDADKSVHLMESRAEVATLPVEEGLLEQGAAHGYFRRDWGPGVGFTGMRPVRGCDMLLWVRPDIAYLHFAAFLVHDRAQERKPRGIVRLTSAGNSTGSFVGGISAVGMRDLDLGELEPDASDAAPATWILRGRVGVGVQVEGFLSCCLQGVAEGVRVLWTAVTQSSQER